MKPPNLPPEANCFAPVRCLKIGNINQAPQLHCREVQSLSLSDNGESGVNICWEKKNKLEVVRRCYNNPDIVRRPQPGADSGRQEDCGYTEFNFLCCRPRLASPSTQPPLLAPCLHSLNNFDVECRDKQLTLVRIFQDTLKVIHFISGLTRKCRCWRPAPPGRPC